jgi:hypothetical protein
MQNLKVLFDKFVQLFVLMFQLVKLSGHIAGSMMMTQND